MRTLITTLMTAALCGVAWSDVPVVSDVTLVQPEFTRKAVVSYKTSGPGIATFQFMTNGVSIAPNGEVTRISGDINRYLPASGAGSYSFTWDAGGDLGERVLENLTVEIKLWSPDNPPLYCAVYMVAQQDGKYPVYWYAAESELPWEITARRWKTDWLLMRKIPSSQGTVVTLGSPDGELGRTPNLEGQRGVTITEPFYLGVYLLTQRQWSQVQSFNPSNWKNASDWQMRPVEYVSFYDIRDGRDGNTADANCVWPGHGHAVNANSFMGVLRAKTGGVLEFDLPTEAQWEYACRAGTSGSYNVDDESLDDLGWYTDNSKVDGIGQTHVVGGKLPNAWGLYDMHGNVWEWCLDWYGEIKDGQIPQAVQGANPVGPSSGQYRIQRGGSWAASAATSRSAYRDASNLNFRQEKLGLRVAARAAVLVEPEE